MSLLFPRLLPFVARSMYSAYVEMSEDALGRMSSPSHESAVYIATGGARISEGELRALRNEVVVLAREHGFPHQSSTALFADFDLKLARHLHSSMNIVAAEAASGDIWAFLGLVLMPDICSWRFPDRPRDRILASDITRHTFGRLWWRAHLTYNPNNADPYKDLGLLNESEIDQIYARRTSLGASSFVVRGILRIWTETNPERNRRGVLRDFLKRLLRLAAFTRFDAQSEEELADTLRKALNASVAAVGGPG
ncbi:DUF6339 family protein [Rhodococcus sp. G-MC3]|uniref:DUF6339 family protein n=1 Tax=Rhodococcus sp. G-MC3 TaxID=3046209 RepID=UPI003FA6C8DB